MSENLTTAKQIQANLKEIDDFLAEHGWTETYYQRRYLRSAIKLLAISELVSPSYIDNRMIKCACGQPDCKIGLNFDQEEDRKDRFMMRLTDKYGNEATMYVDRKTRDEIIKELKSFKLK